jgi:hypothetical protein
VEITRAAGELTALSVAARAAASAEARASAPAPYAGLVREQAQPLPELGTVREIYGAACRAMSVVAHAVPVPAPASASALDRLLRFVSRA